MIFYFATRPETVISVVQVGRLPDAFAVVEMVCYKDARLCSINSTTNRHQTFVLELNLPIPSVSELVTYVLGRDGEECAIAKQIRSEWISKILVYSSQGYNLVFHLFNGECPKCIEQRPEIYPANDTAVTPCSFIIPRAVPIMYALKQGDILGSTMQTLINTVNCVGVMGKGIALAFKERYPEMFADYYARCCRKAVKLGEPYLYKIDDQRWVLNFPTKNHWRHASRMIDIDTGLQYLAQHAMAWGITSLAVPPLGCGNGGLNWDEVYPLIKKYLEPLSLAVEVYVPFPYTRAARVRVRSRTITDFFRDVNDAPLRKIEKTATRVDVKLVVTQGR